MDAWLVVYGRLTKDPVAKSTNNGLSVTTFSVAVNGFNRDGDEKTAYYTVSAFGTLADNCMGKLKKGREVNVIGELETVMDTSRSEPRLYNNLKAYAVKFIPEKKQTAETPSPDAFEDVTSDDVPF